jgi:hypothetical protein
MAKPRAVVVFTFGGSVVVQRLAAADPDPTALELEAIAAAWTPSAGGVAPVVRVLETAPSLRSSGVGGAAGPAGSICR